MASSVQIRVNPAVLKWARESSGAALDEAAKRLKLSPAAFSRLETQQGSLTLTQARTLASYFKRPLAAFLLASPPPEPAPPHDFRTLPGRAGDFERKTRLAIRKALRLRSIAKELMRAMDRQIASQLGRANVSDRPEDAARSARVHLAISADRQQEWVNEWQALREWRAALERRSVFTFQFSMPMDDARGFSLSDEEPYVIVVNSSDAVRGRIFTLFHEFAHLLLRTPGVCLWRLDNTSQTHDVQVERWCNAFAGAFLVPDPGVSHTSRTASAQLTGQALDEAVEDVSRRFKVSEQVALWRLRDLEMVSGQSFRALMEQLSARAGQAKRQGGSAAPAKKSLSQNGPLFTSLVLEARARGIVTYSDVGDYLGVRLKHLPEIESSLAAVVG